MAERITMLFGDNTLGGPSNIVLITPARVEQGKISPIVDPLHISRTAEARDLKFCELIEGLGSNQNYAKVGHTGRVT